ncbi:MAG: type II toxin-antitoxin system HicB family antitoxin [Deltaproteobacteria bacterium]|nr:type II toxin-antitoxin system HicB family antitoxin [Deltaproteobacteria bacterium]
MKRYRFSVLIEQDEEGYLEATVPALRSCYTQARTLEELLPRVKEVIELCIQKEKPVTLVFQGIQQVEVEV